MGLVAPRPGILAIRPHMLEADLAEGGRPLVNLASNESALGASPRALAAAAAALAGAARYPERGPDRLAEAIAAHFGLQPARIVPGPGSDEVLARIARAYLRPGDELVYSRHGYQKFPNYAYANDARPVAAPDEDFRASVEGLLGAVCERTRLVMLANPDNPTGTHLSGAELRALRARLRGDVLLVIDGAYADYVGDPAYEDGTALVAEAGNVVTTRTFSKIYGLAGLRVGWAYGPPEVADALKRIGTTFPLSGVAIAAAVAALSDEAHTAAVRRHNATWRAWFADALRGLGYRAAPSETNFLLAGFGEAAEAAERRLRRHGIVARRFPAPPLRAHIRFTIGLEAEMRAAAAALAEPRHG